MNAPASGAWGLVGPPPSIAPTDPVLETLPRGTLLHRVHGATHPADAFNPTPSATLLTGGRFDTITGEPAYIYAGQDERAALAETLCRDLSPAGAVRLVPFARLRGRRLSQIQTVRDVTVLVLHGPASTKVGAGLALTKSDADQYLHTRAWAHALLTWFPQIDGLAYRCRHDEDRIAYVLYSGSTSPVRAAGALSTVAGSEMPLDSGRGLTLAQDVLADHHAAVEA